MSKNYLVIENDGVCPIQGFDLLGASTARGTDKIGQFGTGLKHGFTALLREGVEAFAFIGEKRVQFFSKPENIGDKKVERVYYRLDDEEHKTSWCTDFGAIDWTSPDMALREFVSNAIDQNNGQACVINFTKEVYGEPNKTRVYVESKQFVRKYYGELEEKFLHFRDGHDFSKKFFPNDEKKGPTIYRKGVFVKTERIGAKEEASLFNYDFADIPIDECRNLSNSSVYSKIGTLISQEKELFVSIIKRIKSGKSCWEYEVIPGYSLWYSWDNNTNKRIGEWWKEEFGNLRITCNDRLKDWADKKGIPCLRLKESWFDKLVYAGVADIEKEVSSPLIKDGMVELDATEKLVANVKKIWDTIVACNMHANKSMPAIRMFDKNEEGSSQQWGLYKGNTIYIHEKAVDNFHVIVHELAHHITGAADLTNDFQEFGYKLAGKLIENL